MKKCVIAFMCAACLCAGCSHIEETPVIEQEPIVFEQTDDMVTELCICHAINADGSVVLWGDRSDDNGFYAYVVLDTTNKLQVGDEIALLYSENVRLHSTVRTELNSQIFSLQSGMYKICEIDAQIAQNACEGSRRAKYLNIYDIAPKQSENDNTEDITPKSTVERIQALSPGHENMTIIENQTYTLDNTMLSPEGIRCELSVSQEGQKYVAKVDVNSFLLSTEYQYVYANQVYGCTSDSFTGTLYSQPSKDQILIYLNASNQIQAGIITEITTAPNGVYVITFTPVSIGALQ